MSDMETLQQLNSRPLRSIRDDPPPFNPVVLAAGSSRTVSVDLVEYVARRVRYDAEECIEKALEDGLIELDYQSKMGRDHDIYRFTAKGRSQTAEHMWRVFERSARVVSREYEKGMRKKERPELAAGAATS